MSTVTETRQTSTVDESASARSPVSRQWMRSTGRFVGGATGALFIVLGAVALMRTGLPTSMQEFTSEHVTAGWLDHTTLLAFIHLFVGASLASAVAYLASGQQAVASGIVMLVLGIIVWIEPSALHSELAVHRVHGVTYALAGGTMMLAGWMISRATTVVTRTIRV